MAWTEERIDLVKQMWADGLSAGQIALRIGNTTRNAVIGKIFRMGLPGRTTRSQAPRPRHAMRRARIDKRLRENRVATPVQKLMAEPFVPQPEPMIPPEERKPILVRKDDGRLHANDALDQDSCRWPCGDVTDADFGFCGRAHVPGLPYCADHARIAYKALNPQPPAHSQPASVEQPVAPIREKVAA